MHLCDRMCEKGPPPRQLQRQLKLVVMDTLLLSGECHRSQQIFPSKIQAAKLKNAIRNFAGGYKLTADKPLLTKPRRPSAGQRSHAFTLTHTMTIMHGRQVSIHSATVRRTCGTFRDTNFVHCRFPSCSIWPRQNASVPVPSIRSLPAARL